MYRSTMPKSFLTLPTYPTDATFFDLVVLEKMLIDYTRLTIHKNRCQPKAIGHLTDLSDSGDFKYRANFNETFLFPRGDNSDIVKTTTCDKNLVLQNFWFQPNLVQSIFE